MQLIAEIGTLINRLIVAIVSVAVILGAIALFSTPHSAIAAAFSDLTSSGSLEALTTWGLVAIPIAVVVLVVQVVHWPLPTAFEASVNGGIVEYPSSLVTRAITRELKRVRGVRDARATTSPNDDKKVDVEVRLTLVEGDDCWGIAAASIDATRENLSSLGLEPGQVRVAIEAVPADQPAIVRRLFATRGRPAQVTTAAPEAAPMPVWSSEIKRIGQN